MEPIIIAVVAVRLLLPLLILRFPLVGVLLCALVDVYDYHFIGGNGWYQHVDKLLDVYYLSFAAFTVLRWHDVIAKRIALWSYVYRIIGVALVILTDQRWLLVLFPNFFEPFFIFYLVFVYVSGTKQMIVSKGVLLLIAASLLIPKLIQEYVLHIYQPNPAMVPEWVTHIVATFQEMKGAVILLYLLPPAAALAWLWLRRIR